MELLTGFGPPFNSTPGQPGQCYKDLNTGDIYKCCQAIDIHTPHFDQAAEYRWKLHIKGDEQADLAETDETKRSFVKNKDSIRPDWNQNDPTQPDYIKNRTHFYKGKETVTLMEEQAVSFMINEGMGMALSPVSFELVEDNIYTVIFDGVEYMSVAKTKNGATFIGNGHIFGDEDTNEPFVYGTSDSSEESHFWVSYDTAKSHTISVYGEVTVIQKLSKDFIPWDESKFKEPIIIRNSPSTWTDKERRSYCDMFKKGHVLYMEEDDTRMGIILSIQYSDIIGLQISLISSNGSLCYWSNTESVWYTQSLDREGIEYTIDEQLEEARSWRILKTIGADIGEPFSAYVTWNKNTKKPSIYKDINLGASSKIVYNDLVLNEDKEIVLTSSTANSTKRFKITVDDSGTISATEVTG